MIWRANGSGQSREQDWVLHFAVLLIGGEIFEAALEKIVVLLNAFEVLVQAINRM